MAPVVLNEDIFVRTLSFIHDVRIVNLLLQSFHRDSSVYSLICKRRFEFPILLTVGSPTYTSKLYNVLLSLPVPSGSIKSLVFAGGPSRNAMGWMESSLTPAEHQALDDLLPTLPLDITYEENPETIRNMRARALSARKLMVALPALLSLTTSLGQIKWTRCPGPRIDVLEAMAKIPALTSFSIECASGEWAGRGMDAQDEYWSVVPLFTTVGPQLRSLELLHVDENTYKEILAHVHHLHALVDFTLNLACGEWDWDGRGSPQIGASQKYHFETFKFSPFIRYIKIETTDIALGNPNGRPLKIIEGSTISRLCVTFTPCLEWVSLRAIRAFSSVDLAVSLVNLSHLVVYEEDGWRKCQEADTTSNDDDENDNENNEEDSNTGQTTRYYVGFHQFIAALPRLDTLWVNESILRPLEIADDPESWSGNATVYSQEETWISHDWISIQATFEQLTSLRVGLGPLTEDALVHVLESCNSSILTQLGFEWSWNIEDSVYRLPKSVFERLRVLSKLRDLHILYPPPIPRQRLMAEGYDQRKQRDLFDNIIAPCLSSLPNLSRFGLGRRCVWERSVPGPGIKLIHDNDPYIGANSFFDAGWNARGKENMIGWAEGKDVQVDLDIGKELVEFLEEAANIHRSKGSRCSDGERKSSQ